MTWSHVPLRMGCRRLKDGIAYVERPSFVDKSLGDDEKRFGITLQRIVSLMCVVLVPLGLVVFGVKLELLVVR